MLKTLSVNGSKQHKIKSINKKNQQPKHEIAYSKN